MAVEAVLQWFLNIGYTVCLPNIQLSITVLFTKYVRAYIV